MEDVLEIEKAKAQKQDSLETSISNTVELFEKGKIDLYEIASLIVGQDRKHKETLTDRLSLEIIVRDSDWSDSKVVSAASDTLLDHALSVLAKRYLADPLVTRANYFMLSLKMILVEQMKRENEKLAQVVRDTAIRNVSLQSNLDQKKLRKVRLSYL